MINPPSASLSYRDNYSVELNLEQLKAIARPNFCTHQNATAEKIHQASQFLLTPWKQSLQLIGKSFQSRPGAGKDDVSIFRSKPASIVLGLTGGLLLVASAALAVLTSPVHLAALLAYRSRPIMSYIDNSAGKQESLPGLTEIQPLHLRSHNLGFVLETMGITGDLRPICDRAHEVATNVLNDPHQPDIMIFQEAFHEDGTRILCEELKQTYSHILHGVLPTGVGFNSGALVASKYPILDTEFHRLEHNIAPEHIAPKGIIRVKIQTKEGPINIYSAHTQPLIGKDRSKVRVEQLIQMREIMKKDFEKDGIPQVLMGDLNTSSITAWGDSNIEDPNNPEKEVQDQLHEDFKDLHLNDHAADGSRVEGNPLYLDSDNARMGQKGLPEPTGSWYIGPFADRSTFLSSSVHKHNERDRVKHGYSTPRKVVLEEKVAWGTKLWRTQQAANTARLDYILVPKESSLDGRVEIRRVVVPEDAQSASTDHLPVDARIWKKL